MSAIYMLTKINFFLSHLLFFKKKKNCLVLKEITKMSEQNAPMNANQLLGIQNAVAGDVSRTITTMDTLASLKAMDYFLKDENKVNPVIKQIASNELKFLEAGKKII